MDNFFRQNKSNAQRQGGFLASLKIFDGLLNWLAGFIKLTEEEQKDAGIYFGDRYEK
jgi:hypothetical protein